MSPSPAFKSAVCLYCPTIVQHPQVICFKQLCRDKLDTAYEAAITEVIRKRFDEGE